QSVAERVLACEPPLLVAQLLREAGAPGGEQFRPARPRESQDRARVPPKDRAADQVGPSLVSPELCPEEDVPSPRRLRERSAERARRRRAVGWRADRTELVSRTVADEPNDAERAPR